VAAEPSVSPGAAEQSFSFQITFKKKKKLFFFPSLCGVEPVRLRRGSRAAGGQRGEGLGDVARSSGGAGAGRACSHSNTGLTRYLAG